MERDDELYRSIDRLDDRSAKERVAYLLCDVAARGCDSDKFHNDLPLRQVLIGNAVGLTPLHVHYVLKDLEREGYIRTQNKRIMIADLVTLCLFAKFDG